MWNTDSPQDRPDDWHVALQELQVFPGTRHFADMVIELDSAVRDCHVGNALDTAKVLVESLQDAKKNCIGTIMQGELQQLCKRALRPIGNAMRHDIRWKAPHLFLHQQCPAGTVTPDIAGNSMTIMKYVSAVITKLMLLS